MITDTVDSHRMGSGRGAIPKGKRGEVKILLREGMLRELISDRRQDTEEGVRCQDGFLQEVMPDLSHLKNVI